MTSFTRWSLDASTSTVAQVCMGPIAAERYHAAIPSSTPFPSFPFCLFFMKSNMTPVWKATNVLWTPLNPSSCIAEGRRPATNRAKSELVDDNMMFTRAVRERGVVVVLKGSSAAYGDGSLKDLSRKFRKREANARDVENGQHLQEVW